MARGTITIARGSASITVLVSFGCRRTPDRVVLALDEDGSRVRLRADEREAALALARAGVDETGR